MIAEYNRKSLMLGIPGLLLQIACTVLSNSIAAHARSAGETPPAPILLLCLAGSLVGLVLLIIGLSYYAKGKGYSGVLGLLGLLSCIGIIILAVLPDKNKE
jgi:hypothetical protein